VDVLTMKELLETGVHFGHRTRKWNPKMARYIFTERKGIHIIDLEQTVDLFRKAYYSVRDSVAAGGEVVFVGTKKQVQATIADEAQRCGAHYVNQRWLGGTLTNFATIKLSIERMKKMEAMVEDGSIEHMPNKEASRMRRRLAKLQRNLDGLRNMEKKPSLMYVIDPDSETIAVHEANLAGIPVIAIVDTNCDPDPIDFLIPGNDDAIKATKLITARIADAILEGREGKDTPEGAPAEAAAESNKAEEPQAPEESAAETSEDAVVESATETPSDKSGDAAETATTTEKVEEETDVVEPEVVEEESVEEETDVVESEVVEEKSVEEETDVVESEVVEEESVEEETDVVESEVVEEESVEEAPKAKETEGEPTDTEAVEEEVTEEVAEVEEDKEKESDDD